MTLPKQIRNLLNLRKQGPVLLEVVDKKNKLIKIREKPSFLSLAGSLPVKNKQGKRLDVVKIRDEMEKNFIRV